jgi:hypothetical protein
LIAVRAHAAARRNTIIAEGEGYRISTTAAAEGGRANAAIRDLLAAELGVPRTRLVLVRGQASRNKLFRLDPP